MTKTTKKKLTKRQKEEIRKCATDPQYFIMNYCKIKTHKGLVLFKLYDYQQDLLEKYHNNRFNIILKGRQLGISELSAAYANWIMMFHKHKDVAILATKQDIAVHLMDKVKLSYDSLPEWLKEQNPKVANNQQSISLSNGSKVEAYSSGPNALRGTTPTLLIVDEAAFIEGIDKIWASSWPSLSTGGSCIVLSTPYGAGTWYHNLWKSAVSGSIDFVPTKLPWNVHPDRDQEWYEKELAVFGPRFMAQEYECSFNASGDTVIDPKVLELIEKNNIENPKYKRFATGRDTGLYIWKEYEDGHTYLISADCARGDAEDYHGIHVIDVTSMEQVAEYYNKIPLDELSVLLYKIAESYGSPLMVVENNTYGYTVLKDLIRKGYRNLYYSKRKTKYEEEQVEYGIANQNDNMVPGFHTGPTTRPMIITILENFLRTDALKIRSSRLLVELRTFIWRGQKPQAAKGTHDDLVMSLAIACYIITSVYIEGGDKKKTQLAALGAIRKNTMVFSGNEGLESGGVHGEELSARRKMYNKYLMETGGWSEVLLDKGERPNRKEPKRAGQPFLPFYKT